MEDLFLSLIMGPIDWLLVEPTLEEELSLEKESRRILNETDHKAVAEICAALVRQNWYQTQVIKKSIGRVGELEGKLLAIADEQKKTRSVWDLVFSAKQKSR